MPTVALSSFSAEPLDGTRGERRNSPARKLETTLSSTSRGARWPQPLFRAASTCSARSPHAICALQKGAGSSPGTPTTVLPAPCSAGRSRRPLWQTGQLPADSAGTQPVFRWRPLRPRFATNADGAQPNRPDALPAASHHAAMRRGAIFRASLLAFLRKASAAPSQYIFPFLRELELELELIPRASATPSHNCTCS